MRIPDLHGAWVSHPDDSRVMIPVDHELSPLSYVRGNGDSAGITKESVVRYRLLVEGLIDNYDGFTIPVPDDTASLDLNRNFPAGWGKEVKGSGDHSLSEPEVQNNHCMAPYSHPWLQIYHLVRAIRSRPNICGYNAYHTNGGIFIRPSSTRPDSDIAAEDLWVWKEVSESYSRV